MKIWQLLLSILILSHCHWSWGSVSQTDWPDSIDQIEKNPLSYQLIRHALFDLENFLNQSIGVKTQSCQYTSIRKNKTFNYADTGACIYRLLLDSVLSKSTQNSIYIWGKSKEDKTIQMQLDWRPQINNFLEVYNQLFEMAFEKQIHSINQHMKGPFKIDFEKRGFGSQTSLLGQLSIRIKSSGDQVNNLLSLISDNYSQVAQVSGASIELSPNGRLNGYMNQKINVQVWESQESKLTHFQVTTNVNLLDPSRKFVVQNTSTGGLQ